MNAVADIWTAIHGRISIRHYERRTVPEEVLNAVVSSGEKSVPLDDSIPVCFHLVRQGRLVAERMSLFTGTQLLFGSAPHFIIAISAERPLFMANMGFRMEQMILHATQLGLGTCWIGGMFDEKRIGAFMNLGKNQRVIALTPIGYPDTSFYGKIARNIIELGAINFGRRKPLNQIAFGTQWGLPLETQDNELIKALECVRLAPSWANTQPWRFLVSSSEVLAVADARGKYGNVRQGKHYYRLDVGIAMAHFFLAAREMRWAGTWDATGFDPAAVAKSRAVPDGYEVLAVYRR
jgi:nitroreductase